MPFTSSFTAEEPPFLPPELSNSNSKSSKSSSLYSSAVDDFTVSPDTAQFEEISLEDAESILPEDIYHKHRKIETASSKKNCSGSPHEVFKSLSDTRRTNHAAKVPGTLHLPRLKPSSPFGRNQQVQASRGQSTKEKVREASRSPSIATSPGLSPTNQGYRSEVHGFASRNQPPAGLRTQLPQSRSASAGLRRQSPQVARKTVKEREDEYNESDEDVLDDAIIWNVPLSPQEVCRDAETTNQLSRNLPICLNSSGYVGSSVSISGPSSMGDVAQAQQTEWTPANNHRSLSWTNAMSNLSVEARDLTQQLEEHAKEKECLDGQRMIKGNFMQSSPSPITIMKRPISASSVQLPPVRRGDLMIDPLPASKEKEKFLTRTRPSWLPPKDPREEQRHLKEYQKMVVHSAQLERKIAAKITRDQKRRDNRMKDSCRSWDNDVLPRWDAAIKEPCTRDLWWHGIIPHSRGTVWMRAIGNDLGLSETSYKIALARAKEIEANAQGARAVPKTKEVNGFKAIKRDVSRTWPALNLFQPGAPLHQPTVDVMMAYSVYRSDTGYVSGTHLPAALLGLTLSPSESFIALSNLLNRPLPLAALLPQSASPCHFNEPFLKKFQAHLPRLHAHFTSLELSPSSYINPFLTTLATWRMPVDIAARIWDVFVFEGDRALVWAFVCLLSTLEGSLYGDANEILSTLGWPNNDDLWNIGAEDDFIARMRGIADCNIT